MAAQRIDPTTGIWLGSRSRSPTGYNQINNSLFCICCQR